MVDKQTPAMFTSRSEEYGTPQPFFDKLDDEFHFTLDPCADHWNAKTARYYTVDDDGLAQSWGGERVFMNPPYGKKIKEWMKKAYSEAKHNGATVVCLVHSRTDTQWFQDYALRSSEIRFVKGRITFDTQGGPRYPAPFPSVVVIFQPNNLDKKEVPCKSTTR